MKIHHPWRPLAAKLPQWLTGFWQSFCCFWKSWGLWNPISASNILNNFPNQLLNKLRKESDDLYRWGTIWKGTKELKKKQNKHPIHSPKHSPQHTKQTKHPKHIHIEKQWKHQRPHKTHLKTMSQIASLQGYLPLDRLGGRLPIQVTMTKVSMQRP